MVEFTRSGNISRRMIGNVDVFDITGEIKNDRIRKTQEYLAAYVGDARSRSVILNVQEVKYIDNNSIKTMFEPLQDVAKRALFYDNDDIGKVFMQQQSLPIDRFCNRESDVVDLLGQELINTRAFNTVVLNRRKHTRIPSAISADVICRQKDSNEVVMTSGIITNISEGGAFIEYLDLNSASLITQIDFLKNVEASVMANDQHYLSQKMNGEISRVEISGRQTCIVIKFFDPITILQQ